MPDSTLRISLVKSDLDACQRYLKAVEDFPNLEIVSVSHTVEEAIRTIQKVNCHAVIIDIGKKNNFDFLKTLENTVFPVPFTYVDAPPSADITPDYVQSKAQPDVSESFVLNYFDVSRSEILCYFERSLTKENEIMLPVEVEDAFAEIHYSQKECPGVYYVSATRLDEAIGSEYYVVEKDSPVISDEAKSYGEAFPDSPNLLLYRIGDSKSGDKIIDFEIRRYRAARGIEQKDDESLADVAMFAREDYPDYFGDFPAPSSVMGKAVLRYKMIVRGVFALETEDHEQYVAVAFPIWLELSDFTMKKAKRIEGNPYVFFHEKSGCLALFELGKANSEITQSPVVNQAAMMNAIWTYHPNYAVQYNIAEQAGQHDILSGILNLFGADTDPTVSAENMIALSLHSNCDYIRM